MHPYVIPNLNDFLSSVEHFLRNVSVVFVRTIEVNGHQYSLVSNIQKK